MAFMERCILSIWQLASFLLMRNGIYGWWVSFAFLSMNTVGRFLKEAAASEESPLDAAKRELLEETGLSAEEWTPILSMHLSNSVSDEKAILWLARKLSQGEAKPEETERLQIKKVPFDLAYEWVESGKISDCMTVAAIQKLKLMMLEGRIQK